MLSFFTMPDLAHKIVLVTGASGGLGHALAEAFAAQESRVVITARNHEQLNRAAEEMDATVRKPSHGRAISVAEIKRSDRMKKSLNGGATCRFSSTTAGSPRL